MHRRIWIAVTALFVLTASAAEPQKAYPLRRFVIEFATAAPGVEQAFRAAVGYDGRLEVIQATTPFRKEFDAASLTAMFEATNTDGAVRATLYGDQRGTLTLFGNVSGRSGKITDEPWHDCVTLSFGPF
jgi:hypothetical protein